MKVHHMPIEKVEELINQHVEPFLNEIPQAQENCLSVGKITKNVFGKEQIEHIYFERLVDASGSFISLDARVYDTGELQYDVNYLAYLIYPAKKVKHLEKDHLMKRISSFMDKKHIGRIFYTNKKDFQASFEGKQVPKINNQNIMLGAINFYNGENDNTFYLHSCTRDVHPTSLWDHAKAISQVDSLIRSVYRWPAHLANGELIR